MALDRQAIVDYAENLIGTAFHLGQRTPGVGIDCMGILVLIARDVIGFDMEKQWYRATDTVTAEMAHDEMVYWGFTPRPAEEAEPGDVVTVELGLRKSLRHYTLFTEDGLINAHREIGQVVKEYWTDAVRARMVQAYIWPEPEEPDV